MGPIETFTRGTRHVWRHRRTLSILKLVNMGLVNIQFRLKTERVLGRPYRMKIEPTNICNTRCQLCPTGIGLRGRPRGMMALDDFKRLVDRMKRYLVAIDLSMWGDPLIAPDIYAMIRYAHDARIWTYISSNLHAFDPDTDAQALIDSGLDELVCSLHGATQATFEAYQPGKNFADTVDKVRKIVETRDRLGRAEPRIRLNFVVTRRNEHERESFQRLARELGCETNFATPALNVRFLDRDRRLVPLGLDPATVQRKRVEHLREWLPQDETLVLPAYQRMLENDFDPETFNGSKTHDCDWPWRAAVINWDGEVVTCCGSFDPAEDMGNVFAQPFSRVWNGHRYRMARRSFRRKVSAEDGRDNPCVDCPGFMV